MLMLAKTINSRPLHLTIQRAYLTTKEIEMTNSAHLSLKPQKLWTKLHKPKNFRNQVQKAQKLSSHQSPLALLQIRKFLRQSNRNKIFPG